MEWNKNNQGLILYVIIQLQSLVSFLKAFDPTSPSDTEMKPGWDVSMCKLQFGIQDGSCTPGRNGCAAADLEVRVCL